MKPGTTAGKHLPDNQSGTTTKFLLASLSGLGGAAAMKLRPEFFSGEMLSLICGVGLAVAYLALLVSLGPITLQASATRRLPEPIQLGVDLPSAFAVTLMAAWFTVFQIPRPPHDEFVLFVSIGLGGPVAGFLLPRLLRRLAT